MSESPDDLLRQILASGSTPFAILYRPEETGPGLLDLLVGEVSVPASLADVPLPHGSEQTGHHAVLVVIPYRQVSERGFAAVDDGSPLLAMTVRRQEIVRVADVLERLPNVPIELIDEHFDLDDEAYAETARRIVTNVIGEGEGANFVLKRSFIADIGDYGLHRALSFFRRLLERETGAYWTFIIHTGARTFVGASPERHVSLSGDVAVMNPISGTYRYPAVGPNLDDVMGFLTDPKEVDELYMVVDEELKMMARICGDGGRVIGPYLKEMAHLAHTEYVIEGRTTCDVRDVLRETLLAPTVTGSPLENACQVISRYEPHGRSYYSGVAALIGSDGKGERLLDSAILIRTADINESGRVRIGVGATLVRHSDPAGEAAETRAKAAGLIAALKGHATARFGSHPKVRAALASRNDSIADFWLRDTRERKRALPEFVGRKVLVVDAEDTFTSMIANQLQSLGLSVVLRRFDEGYTFDGYDLVVMGPGPGNPSDLGQPKIAHLRGALGALVSERKPFLAVCLSHQVLSSWLGLELRRRTVPNQGVQKEIDLFGVRERVGFYNTFSAVSREDEIAVDGVGMVEVSRDKDTNEVHALRGPHFASMQFHLESILTKDGPRIVARVIRHVLPAEAENAPIRSAREADAQICRD
jgi:phenazine biosynthesis protein phzE